MLDAASEASKGKQKSGSTFILDQHTWIKTGRNGLRVGDIELEISKEDTVL
jgi:hypothetical protein